MVELTKKRILIEVQAGRRAFAVSFAQLQPDSPVFQAAEYAAIDAIAERLAHAPFPKMFSGYVTVYVDGQVRAVYPEIQPLADAILAALARQPQTPQGMFISARTPDVLQRVIVQQSYPAYYVYEVSLRQGYGHA